MSIYAVAADLRALRALASADALETLLVFHEEVRLALMDYIAFEIERMRNVDPVAATLTVFMRAHPERIEVVETAFGRTMMQVARCWEGFRSRPALRREMLAAGISPIEVPPDAAVLSIFSFANILVAGSETVLVITADDFLLANNVATPGNVRVISVERFRSRLAELAERIDTEQ